jgi:hypothetical protein
VVVCIYILYRKGDGIEPWGTPASIALGSGDKYEMSEPTFITKLLFSKYDLKNKK